jgi:hypothetical protein
MKQLFIKLLFSILLLTNNFAQASLFFQESANYMSDSDTSGQKLNYTNLKSVTLIGAEFLKSRQGIIGQNIIYSTRDAKEDYSGKTTSLKMLELGPRFQFFFDEPKTSYISFTFNPYAKGKRVILGETETVSGTSFLINMGYQLKITKSIFAGLSVNYHSLSLSTKTIDTTETKISESYSTIYPMIEFSVRFR